MDTETVFIIIEYNTQQEFSNTELTFRSEH